MALKKQEDNFPEPSALVAYAQVVEILGVDPARVDEVVELGWVRPARTGADGMLFRMADVYRMRKLYRICRDLELTELGGTIILDLMDKVERLETRIKELEKLS